MTITQIKKQDQLERTFNIELSYKEMFLLAIDVISPYFSSVDKPQRLWMITMLFKVPDEYFNQVKLKFSKEALYFIIAMRESLKNMSDEEKDKISEQMDAS